MNICKTIETMAQDLHEIKNNTVRLAVKEVFKEHLSLLGWVSVAKHGHPRTAAPPRHWNYGCSIDVLVGTAIDGEIRVVGWGYYSYSFERWYVASSENLPHPFLATREKITHYLLVPKYARN